MGNKPKTLNPAWPIYLKRDHISHLFLFQDGFLLEHFNRIELVIATMASQKNLSETAFSDNLQEVEVGGLSGRVRRRPQVYLLRRTGLQDETESQLGLCHFMGVSCKHKHKHRHAGGYLQEEMGCSSSAQDLAVVSRSEWNPPLGCSMNERKKDRN